MKPPTLKTKPTPENILDVAIEALASAKRRITDCGNLLSCLPAQDPKIAGIIEELKSVYAYVGLIEAALSPKETPAPDVAPVQVQPLADSDDVATVPLP